MEGIVFLDTHVVVFLYAGELDMFSNRVLQMINENRVYISPIVKLEIKYLNEIGRVKQKPDIIIDALNDEIGLTFSKNSFEKVVNQAIHFEFTRDPFDRIIVADASLNNSYLISKDDIIMKNYKNAIW